MFPNTAAIHENVSPEIVKDGSIELRQDTLGRDYKGKSNKAVAKKTSKLIEKLRPQLGKFLDAGEQVLYIARVQRHASGVIQYTMGWYIYYASAAVIVFTNRRLLHLRVNNSNQWTQGVRTCAWSEIESADVSGWLGSRVLKLKFKNGTRYRYWRISRADALNIKKLLPLVLKAHEGVAHRSTSLVCLCPECKQELAPGNSACAGCGLSFKSKQTMYWLSLLPSAAYIYTRHWALAVIDLIGQSYGYILLGMAAYTVIAAAMGSKNAQGKTILMSDAMGLLLAGLFIFGLDVIITIHHNNYFIEDFLPAAQKAQPAESIKGLAAGGSIG